jgi:hypothetical protein
MPAALRQATAAEFCSSVPKPPPPGPPAPSGAAPDPDGAVLDPEAAAAGDPAEEDWAAELLPDPPQAARENTAARPIPATATRRVSSFT